MTLNTIIGVLSNIIPTIFFRFSYIVIDTILDPTLLLLLVERRIIPSGANCKGSHDSLALSGVPNFYYNISLGHDGVN